VESEVSAQTIPLWPEGAPGPVVPAKPEGVDEDGCVVNVTTPTLTIFEGSPVTRNGLAAIVCPGGGYTRLAIRGREGEQLPRWLTGLGVTVFLLKYRIAPQRHPAPLRDVLRAVRLVRARAGELGVDPHRIGLFGCSAGGHLAATAATLYDAPEGKTGAALDAVSARPDFVVLQYPVISMREACAHAGSRAALLGHDVTPALADRLSVERQVTRGTPRCFLVHTQEDESVPVENSLAFYQALRAAGVPVEMHLYEKGPHGFGIADGLGPTSDWPARCEAWLRAHGWLRA
jgi:acetyl esterase/lipase